MNSKKSADYCKLIENVKNKYRKNPIYAKNLTLGWCDLRRGEDLCQEINLWTYWQGRDYAKKTPHIKYMLIGQDFGPPEKEEIKGTIANVRKMNDGIDVMFHENVDLEARDSQTDKNIVGYFELLGKNEIDKKKYPDLFFCNCNLGYRRDKYSGNMTRKILPHDAAEIKSLIDIIEPENIICLGLDTSVVVIRTLIDKKFSCNRVSELIGTGEPYIYGETYIYPVVHPGYWGTSTRGDIDSYIDANYVRESHRKEYPVRSRSSARTRELSEEAFYEEMLQREAENNYPLEEDTGLAEPCMLSADISLEDQLANIGVSFHDKLFELIDESHLDNKDVWKRANLDRKHFSKIQCDQNYHPKKTVMALCIALQLDLEQSKDLLARADWAFSPSSKVDLIVQKAIIDKQYDIMQLNVTLFKYTNEILGV